MYFIYKNATSVIAWLGEAADNSNKAFELINLIFSVLTNRPERIETSLYPFEKVFTDRYNNSFQAL
jgi:hypothetical protein